MRHASIIIAVLHTMLGLVFSDAIAQKADYPSRPIRLVVPFAPGGGTDVMARVLSQRIAQTFGASIVVDNRPGGGGIVACETVVRAAPDGYTLMFDTASYTTRAALYKLTFDPVQDVSPIAQAFISGYVVVLHPGPSVPARNVKELIEHGLRQPGKLNYGSSGVGGFVHLGTELFLMLTGARMNHVPYKGAAPALNDLMGGQIHVMWGSLTAAVPQMKANRLRGIAVTTLKRWHELPDLPAVSETVPGYEAAVWYGLWGPRNLPKTVVAAWNNETNRIVQLPEMKPRLASEGVDPVVSTPENFRETMRRDIAKWSKVVKEAKLKPTE